jgi:hypothetical protein
MCIMHGIKLHHDSYTVFSPELLRPLLPPALAAPISTDNVVTDIPLLPLLLLLLLPLPLDGLSMMMRLGGRGFTAPRGDRADPAVISSLLLLLLPPPPNAPLGAPLMLIWAGDGKDSTSSAPDIRAREVSFRSFAASLRKQQRI